MQCTTTKAAAESFAVQAHLVLDQLCTEWQQFLFAWGATPAVLTMAAGSAEKSPLKQAAIN